MKGGRDEGKDGGGKEGGKIKGWRKEGEDGGGLEPKCPSLSEKDMIINCAVNTA